MLGCENTNQKEVARTIPDDVPGDLDIRHSLHDATGVIAETEARFVVAGMTETGTLLGRLVKTVCSERTCSSTLH
jgi:hypothetical protein